MTHPSRESWPCDIQSAGPACHRLPSCSFQHWRPELTSVDAARVLTRHNVQKSLRAWPTVPATHPGQMTTLARLQARDCLRSAALKWTVPTRLSSRGSKSCRDCPGNPFRPQQQSLPLPWSFVIKNVSIF
eukprot:jgi/Botrbrau1/1966/Bobra.0052s0009.1